MITMILSLYTIFVWIYSVCASITTDSNSSKLPDIKYILLCLIPMAVFMVIIIIVVIKCCILLKWSEVDSSPEALIIVKETLSLSSVMEALAGSDKFVEQLDELSKMIDNNKITQLISLLKNLKDENRNKQSIQEGKRLLQDMANFAELDQEETQDPFQIFAIFINEIQKDINEFLTGRNIIMPPKCRILLTSSENSSDNKINDQLSLVLSLCGNFEEKPGVYLEYLLDEYFNPFRINEKSHESQKYFYEEVPNVLIFLIQTNERTNLDDEFLNKKYYVTYGEVLKYIFEVHAKSDGSEYMKIKVDYQLMAVVHHMGSVAGGHHITYRRHDQHWYLTKDEKMKKISFKCKSNPYLMVYEKRSEERLE